MKAITVFEANDGSQWEFEDEAQQRDALVASVASAGSPIYAEIQAGLSRNVRELGKNGPRGMPYPSDCIAKLIECVAQIKAYGADSIGSRSQLVKVAVYAVAAAQYHDMRKECVGS